MKKMLLSLIACFANTHANPQIVLVKPQNGAVIKYVEDNRQLRVTEFEWKVVKPFSGSANHAQCSEVILDKGKNPFDGQKEESFFVENETRLVTFLHGEKYLNPNTPAINWAVRVTYCTDSTENSPCGFSNKFGEKQACDGKAFQSKARIFRFAGSATRFTKNKAQLKFEKHWDDSSLSPQKAAAVQYSIANNFENRPACIEAMMESLDSNITSRHDTTVFLSNSSAKYTYNFTFPRKEITFSARAVLCDRNQTRCPCMGVMLSDIDCINTLSCQQVFDEYHFQIVKQQ